MSDERLKSDNIAQMDIKNRKKVLVADDSALMRRVMCDIINSDEGLYVEDEVRNGLEAYDLLTTKSYDAVVLDIIMPKMTGLELLERLQKDGVAISAIMASTLTKEGADETLKALELGAIDFVAKPNNFIEAKGADYTAALLAAIKNAIAITAKRGRSAQSGTHVRTSMGTAENEANDSSRELQKPKITETQAKLDKLNHNKPIGPAAKSKIVALACSTGGPKSLQSVVPFLPGNLDAPVLIVQHMPAGFTAMMASKLDKISKLHIQEAAEGDIIRKGNVYVAPGGFHMNVVKSGTEYRIKLTDEPIREGVKPCANYMYESLISSNFEEITCVVLTGMGADGTAGIKNLAKEKKIYCIAQDEATSVVYGMPRAIYEAGLVNQVVPLDGVVEAIIKNVGVN